jgi:hypothetical protein
MIIIPQGKVRPSKLDMKPAIIHGATTFSITTVSITTVSIITFSITTFSKMTFSITTFSIMTFSITTAAQLQQHNYSSTTTAR